jgi:glycosyltransferase involved in cell wall biosynthesis
VRAHAVSVIIPVYNGARYLGEAIGSVLAQTDPAGQILVVNDGSTDASPDVARSFGPGVTCVTQPHAGLSAALNRGVEGARGGLLAFLDADDLWAAHKLSRQLDALDADPAVEAVFAHIEQFVSPELDPAAAPRLLPGGRRVPGWVLGAMLIRAEAFRRVGAFDVRWRIGPFVDWYLRAQDAGLRATMLPDTLLRRRLHADNLGTRERALRGDYARILKSALLRRRAAGVQAGEPGPPSG